MDPKLSANTTFAPPCKSPNGWVFPLTGIVPTILCGEASMISIPIFWSNAPRPRSFRAAKFSSLNLLSLLSALICQSYALNLGSRYGEIQLTKLAKLAKLIR
jgi:hypothetical protein